jgi:hypothetical protein
VKPTPAAKMYRQPIRNRESRAFARLFRPLPWTPHLSGRSRRVHCRIANLPSWSPKLLAHSREVHK